MSIEELSLLISSSITFKTITPLIPVMFYFLGTQTKSQDIKDTIKNKVTFSFALFFQLFVSLLETTNVLSNFLYVFYRLLYA